jgi:hypothetical protein
MEVRESKDRQRVWFMSYENRFIRLSDEKII